jgi:CheY-like chemotaxis protein
MTNDNIKQSKKTILITEDQDSNYLLLEVLMEMWGINTLRASTGQESVNICKENKDIDLVLMDIRLPDFNGLEATRIIKKENPNLPIIAQTAYAIVGDREKALDAGCDEYISKPIRKDQLHELILQFLE